MSEDKALAEFKAVNEMLKIARKHGLEAEVVWSALQHQTSDPSISLEKPDIACSCQAGLASWDI